MEEIERHMQELGNDDSLSDDAFTCSYSSHPFLCVLDVYYPLPGGREMVWEVNRSESGSEAFNIYPSLVPRPRPLTREKGSGDLQPIPRASLSIKLIAFPGGIRRQLDDSQSRCRKHNLWL